MPTWLCLTLLMVLLLATSSYAVTGVTFYASFDRWLLPEVAAGSPMPVKVAGLGATKAVPVNGKFDHGLVLDGNSYIEYSPTGNIPATAGTVALWFRPEKWGAKTYDNILAFSDSDTNALDLERSHPDGRLRLVIGGPQSKDGSATRSIWSREPLRDGQWVHIAVTWNLAQRRADLYLNGVLNASLTGAGPPPQNPPSLLVGAGWGRLGRAVSGVIDDLVLLDHPASKEELTTIMAGMNQSQSAPQIANQALAVSVDHPRGLLTIGSTRSMMPELLIGPAQPEAHVGGQPYTWQKLTETAAAGETIFSAPANESGLSLRYHVQMQDKRPVALLWMEVVNTTDKPVKVDKLVVLRTVAPGAVTFGSPGGTPRIFTDNGGLMGSGSHDLLQPKHEHTAHGAMVVTDAEAGWAASCSFVTFRTATVTNQVTTGDAGLPEALAAVCDYPNGYLLAPGATLKSEVVEISIYDEPHAALEAWADTVMAVNHFEPPKFCPSGWNSWYCYRLTITEDLILEHARFIKEHWDGLGLENIQIDHGWQDRDIIGNWVANKRFPHGLPWLSDQLKHMGFSLGLWTAVTGVSEFAPLYQEHPEALIQGADGKPLVTGDYWFWEPHGKTFTADPTSPTGLADFRKVGEDLKSYGCAYNKNDFQGDLLTTAGQLYDKTLTRGAPVYIKGMEEFAKGKGPQMAYHACNAPLNIVAGMADVAWVHGDIGNPGGRWDWLRGFVRDFSCRYHVSGKFYWSDPDYLQVGQGTMEEARVRMAICALGGGPAFLSDRLPELPAERLALIPKCLPSYKRCATPVDLFERDDYPHLWDLPVATKWGQWHVLAVFNLDEKPGSVVLNLGQLGLEHDKDYLLYDFFSEKLLGEVKGLGTLDLMVKVPLPATDVRVLKVVEKQARPFVLSTDMHLTQGGVELPEVSWDEKTLTLSGVATRSPGMKGKVLVYVPEGYRAPGMNGRVLTIPVEFREKRAEWKAKFTKG